MYLSGLNNYLEGHCQAVYLFAFLVSSHFVIATKKNNDETDFVLYSGTSHAGPGSSHVYPVRYWCVPGTDNVHEELRCKPVGQEE